MAKLTLMIGLPASGKSTTAEVLMKERGNTVRVNKDLLRTMLHFDKWSGNNEGMTRGVARIIAREMLKDGMNVIVDDTNLNPGTVQSWVDLAKEMDAKIEKIEMPVMVEEFIERDSKREKKVGAHVIYKMALQHCDYMKGEKVVICDLDGTLCNIEHRLGFVTHPKDCGFCAALGEGMTCGFKADWKSFFGNIAGDSLREDVAEKVWSEFKAGAKIMFVSARPETYRKETEEWLWNNGFGGQMLIMREAQDRRDDVDVKAEIHAKYLKNLDIVKVLDDRPKVIRMWREKGLNVEDVGNGIEF